MKYKEWLDVWFANYIEPSSKTKTCERYSEIIEKHLKVKLDIWLENYVKPTSKIKTYMIYKQIVEKRLKPRLGEYDLNEISPVILQCYVTELLRQGNAIAGTGLSVNTVNGIITVIQNFLKLACMIGESEKYIADKIKRPKTSEKEVSCFTVAEQKKIERAVLVDKRQKMFGIVLCLYTGLRIGELLALTWKDIDFIKGVLSVNKTIHDGKDENGRFCSIGDSAFRNCSGFTSIRIPDSVTTIGGGAFNSERDFRKTQQKTPNNIENSLQMIA